MKDIVELGMALYAYCTDFIINLANLSNSSYYEINFFVFCIAYPMLLVGSFALYLIQKRRLKIIKKDSETEKSKVLSCF